MKQLIYILIVIVFFSCNTEKKVKSKEDIIREYIGFVNKGDKNNIDLLTSFDFKLYNDTVITKKNDFLKKIIKPIANRKVKIIQVETIDAIVKTTEGISDDFTNYFKTDTIKRIREYHFSDSNLIKSINNVEIVTPTDYLKIQKKFGFWAKQEYPNFYKKMEKRVKDNKSISDETKYLLSKLQENGFDALNNIDLIKIRAKKQKQIQKKDYITTTSFRKFAMGKSKKELKNRFGNPCYTQQITGLGLVWYYGELYCNNSRIIIFDKDSKQEVMQAQIVFSEYTGLVRMINFL